MGNKSARRTYYLLIDKMDPQSYSSMYQHSYQVPQLKIDPNMETLKITNNTNESANIVISHIKENSFQIISQSQSTKQDILSQLQNVKQDSSSQSQNTKQDILSIREDMKSLSQEVYNLIEMIKEMKIQPVRSPQPTQSLQPPQLLQPTPRLQPIVIDPRILRNDQDDIWRIIEYRAQQLYPKIYSDAKSTPSYDPRYWSQYISTDKKARQPFYTKDIDPSSMRAVDWPLIRFQELDKRKQEYQRKSNPNRLLSITNPAEYLRQLQQ